MTMNMYLYKNEKASANAVVLDDLFLTKDMHTTGGSHMLDGYMSLFDAEVIAKLADAGYDIAGKANVGEFSIDMLGESSYYGACEKDGKLTYAPAELLAESNVKAALCFDINGTPRRAAALCGKTLIKPTYGTVSRFGTIAVACSGETVSVMADSSADCAAVLTAIAGHDDKDGTSLSESDCAKVKSGAEFTQIKKIAVAKSICDSADDAVKADIAKFREVMGAKGIEFVEIDDSVIALAKTAWNVCMSAELCNNVSRLDGVKYGYRTKNYKTIEELYTNSRTEAFGELLKTAILFGSDALSTENYMKVYDKSLRIRTVVIKQFAELFADFGAVLMPACGKAS